MICRALTAAILLAAPAHANEAFVENNLLGVFYHEFGHALIDILGLPVFGQEEDAADVLSIYMVDQLFEPEAAEAIAYDMSALFAAEADESPDFPYWDVHGPDAQRFYNTLCLFVGADMDTREDMAEELGLPEDRLISCEEEFQLANDSWGPVLDDIAGSGSSLQITSSNTPLGTLMMEEIAALNETFVLPQTLQIKIDACGEGNAFYDPNDQSITMCEELPGYIERLTPNY